MKRDSGAEGSCSLLRAIVGAGLNNVELRDEIYCQLMRQSTRCPSDDALLRAWQVFAVCSVSFPPCPTFKKVSIPLASITCVTSAVRLINEATLCICKPQMSVAQTGARFRVWY